MNQTCNIDPPGLYPRRIPSLDGLRALAIINVVIAHVSLTASYLSVMDRPALRGVRFLLGITCNPRMGVDLFFTLSGFLITWLLLTEEHRKGEISLRMFYARRALRILPVYWCFLVAAQVLHTIRPTVAGSPLAFLAALTFTTGWWPDDPHLLGHTWSLSVEETFYLLWPLALCTLGSKGRWRIAVIVIAIAPLIRIGLAVAGQNRLLTFTCLSSADAIMWGCLAAMVLWRSPARVTGLVESRPTTGRLIALGVFLFCNASGWFFHHSVLIQIQRLLHTLMIPFSVTFHSLASAYLIWSLTLYRRGLLFQILNQRLVVALGVLSYSLYLWQEPFLSYPSTYTPAWWQRFPQNILLALLISAISYVAIERPILNLKRFLKGGGRTSSYPTKTADAGNITENVLP